MTDKTYKVLIKADNSCLNHVRHADAERDVDGVDVRNKKRLDEAMTKMRAWSDSVYRDTALVIAECDNAGKVLKVL